VYSPEFSRHSCLYNTLSPHCCRCVPHQSPAAPDPQRDGGSDHLTQPAQHHGAQGKSLPHAIWYWYTYQTYTCIGQGLTFHCSFPGDRLLRLFVTKEQHRDHQQAVLQEEQVSGEFTIHKQPAGTSVRADAAHTQFRVISQKLEITLS
jgi:hypothetical protein